MKHLFIALASILITQAAHADYFACHLTVGKETAEEQAEYKATVVSVSLKGYYCAATTNGPDVFAQLYEPGVTDDDDAISGRTYGGRPALIEIRGASCLCGWQ